MSLFSNKMISFKYAIFMVCLFIYAYTYSLYEEPKSESCHIDYTYEAELRLRNLDMICYGHRVFDFGVSQVSPKIWYCDNGFIGYDHSGVVMPWDLSRRTNNG